MHELAVTENILEISLRHASQANAKRITALNIVIGQLASVVDDSLQFYWDMISSGTLAEGAVLNFIRTPGELTCLHCKNVFSIQTHDFICPECLGTDVQVTSGTEFFLESIEIENSHEVDHA